VSDDIGMHNTRKNKAALQHALSLSELSCPELHKLEPLLAKHRLTEDETSAVVLAALKEEVCVHYCYY
jgi:uridylate kinase